MTTQREKAVRGQSMVLLAATAALVAFTLLTTLTIGRAVRERIQIQQAADAAAYSEAVQEARVFNFYAYTNRAVIAHYVVMMSIYGHMSYLAYYESILNATYSGWACDSGGWLPILTEMAAELACWCDPFCLFNPGWCAGGAECLAQEAEQIPNECDTLNQTIQQVDQKLGKNQGTNAGFMGTLNGWAKRHHDDWAKDAIIDGMQEGVDANMIKALQSQEMTKQIAQQFDSSYDAPKLASLMTLDGVNGDSHAAGYCGRGGVGTGAPGPVTSDACKLADPGHNQGESPLTSSQQQAANASRYGPSMGGVLGDWLRNRSDGMLSMIEAKLMAPSIMGNEERITLITDGQGASREVATSSNPVSYIQKGDYSQGGCSGSYCGSGGGGSTAVAGEDHGDEPVFGDLVCVTDGLIGFGLPQLNIQTWAVSNPTGNGTVHYNDGTEQSVDQIGGKVGAASGLGLKSINFNPGNDSGMSQTDDENMLFNQPRTWAILTKAFNAPSRTGTTSADQGPSSMNQSFTFFGDAVHYNNGITTSSGGADYSAGRENLWGIAQGLAYYHRPGDWKEPPNFYNPYWRAKLLPLDWRPGRLGSGPRVDFAEALGEAGLHDPMTLGALATLPVTQ